MDALASSGKVIRLLSQAEARLKTDMFKQCLETGRALLLELYEGEAWRALGYASWREYGQVEFGKSVAYLYQLKDFALVERNLLAGDFSAIAEKSIILPATESQARPLAQLEPDEQRAVWQEVVAVAT